MNIDRLIRLLAGIDHMAEDELAEVEQRILQRRVALNSPKPEVNDASTHHSHD